MPSAAQVGAVSVVAPGANIGDECALLEATPRDCAEICGPDKVNLCPLFCLRRCCVTCKWFEAAILIAKGMEGAIAAKTVTHDLNARMEGAKLLKCSEFLATRYRKYVITIIVVTKNGDLTSPVFIISIRTVIKILSKNLSKLPHL